MVESVHVMARMRALGFSSRPWHSWNGNSTIRVRIVYGDRLIVVGEVPYDAFSENIEGASQKNVICGRADDV
jgi:hypothetical protein